MKHQVLLGITSGIAAYKCLELVHILQKNDIDVHVIMTHHATQMVPQREFENVSGHRVHTDLFEKGFDYKKILTSHTVDHIALADTADVFVIAPATANIIAKLSYGIADDFLTTTALAVTKPIIICPSMNVNMWYNPVVQENLERLRARGYHIVHPESGMLACGYEGMGRLADIQTIKQEILDTLAYTKTLAGKKVIVTAGGTMEKIDDVRYITNRSSGKMGVAIAEECYLRGADVLLLRAKNSVHPRYVMKEELFTTAGNLSELVQKYVPTYDYFYHAAAVSDFTVDSALSGKISSKKSVTLKLKPQIKILDTIKKLNPRIRLIAFKAESEPDQKKLAAVAHERLIQSGADAIIANDVSRSDRGFEVDANEVTVIFSDGILEHIPLASKRDIAKRIVDTVTSKLGEAKKIP